jgi:hypothetical protein
VASAAGEQLGRTATDHVVPRVKGGTSWLENEVASQR